MSHTRFFANIAKLLRRAQGFDATRRQFIKQAGAIGAAAAFSTTPSWALGSNTRSLDVGIVGAGLAGLVCADVLKRNAIRAVLYEASDHVGGRCSSLRGFFPGQTAERGGEFIDNLGKTMLGYAKQFGLTLEDVTKVTAAPCRACASQVTAAPCRACASQVTAAPCRACASQVPGEVSYYFNRRHVSEAAIVDEFRAFISSMNRDLRRLSPSPTADSFNTHDAELDLISLAEYLQTRGAGPLAKAAITAAYEAEYGLAVDRQSSLDFLMFIHADRRSKFTPFGVFSDERWHIVEGNDSVALGLAGLLSDQIEYGKTLVRVRKTTAGRIELTFSTAAGTQVRSHDAVVLAIPFSVLRSVDLDSSLGLPPWKRNAIDLLGYGTNAKMMLGFNGRPWSDLGSSGASYSDLAHHQTTWETNPTSATAVHAILTDYSSGARGAQLNTGTVQQEAAFFLNDLNLVYPGAFAVATRDSAGKYLAHLAHWPSNPLTKGSYTCYLPGQFTSIAGNEGKPIDNLYFAGEHANSFYEWQGFMEGAALSGVDAAKQITKGV